MMTSVSPSCVCNTHTRKHKDDHRLELIAQSPIKEGEQVLIIILIRVIREVEIYFQSDQRSRNIFHDNDSIQRSRNLFFWRSGRGTRRLSWEAIREWRTWRKLGAHCFSFMINKNKKLVTWYWDDDVACWSSWVCRHFTCTCPRCVDPSELGSMMSAVWAFSS